MNTTATDTTTANVPAHTGTGGDGKELEQAADALATMSMKTDEASRAQATTPVRQPAAASTPTTVAVATAVTTSPAADKPPASAAAPSAGSAGGDKQAQCSACGKVIPNQIADGHSIVQGHVGQFRMLIPWTPGPDGAGVLCSRCYQKNWRTNRQRMGTEDKDAAAEPVPREPYVCLCGMSFQSSQLKAAHCRLCQKYREVADQEQRQHPCQASPSRPAVRELLSAHKRPRTMSELQSTRQYQRAQETAGLFTPMPAKVRAVLTPTMLSGAAIAATPLGRTTMECAQPMVLTRIQVALARVQLAQLLQTTRLLGQIDLVQYASLAKMVATASDETLVAEVAHLILPFALKPLVGCNASVCSTPLVGSPQSKCSKDECPAVPPVPPVMPRPELSPITQSLPVAAVRGVTLPPIQ